MVNIEKLFRFSFLSLIFLFSFSYIAFAQKTREGDISNLKKLYDGKQYFGLRDAVKNFKGKASDELYFFRGAIANKFNEPQVTINYLQAYLKRIKNKDKGYSVDSYEMLADNYRKTYQYRKASEAYNTILTKLKSGLTAEKIKDYENALNLWRALKDVPLQTVLFKGASKIQTFRNQADLINIPFSINDKEVALVLDTGANISTISGTYAKKLGLKIIETSVDIGSSTGEKSKAKLGVANEVRIGSVTARNVVFLIFPDEALYIPPLSLQLNGYIGFPLINAFREIILTRNGEFMISAQPGKPGIQNMCLDGLFPLIEGEYEGSKLTFSLDTGANTSDLYPPFYKAYEKEIKENYPPQTSNRAGVGSLTTVTAYYAKNLVIKFAGKNAKFSQITILPDYTTLDSHYFYGNLGQDLVKQFEKMTLNFQSMSIAFE